MYCQYAENTVFFHIDVLCSLKVNQLLQATLYCILWTLVHGMVPAGSLFQPCRHGDSKLAAASPSWDSQFKCTPLLVFQETLNAKTFWVSWNKWQIRESNNDQGCSPVDKEVSVSCAKAACALALTVSSQELSAPAAAGRTETANGTTLLSIEVKWSTVCQGLEGVRVYEPWKSYDFLSKNLLWKQLVCAPSLAFCFMSALGL